MERIAADAGSAEQSLLRIIEAFLTELGTPALVTSADVDLEADLGLGSLESVELVTRIEQAFLVRLPDSAVAKVRTPRDLLAALLVAVESHGRRLGGSEIVTSEPTARSSSASPAASRTRAAPRRWHEAVYGAYASVVGGGLFLLGIGVMRLVCRTERSAWWMIRRVLRLIGRATGLSPRLLGHPLPAGGAILVSNHASYIDAFVLMAALERRFALTVKAEVFGYPFVGRIARLLGHVPIFRSSVGGSLAAYRAAQEAASQGKIIHFFPEATFAWAAEIRRFRLGAFALAAEKGLPVYPVAIRGARRVLRDGEGMPRRAPLEVEVLAPLFAPATGRFEEIARLRETARAALGEAVGERLVESTSIALPEGTPLDPELSKID